MFKDDAAACPDAGDDGDNGKQTGKAMRWDERGWGFIKPDDGGEVLFCHYSVIEDGNALVELWIEHYAKVSEEGRLLLRMRPVYFLDLAD